MRGLHLTIHYCAGSDQEEVHYKYQLTVIHGKSEYSYKGPVISLMRSANEVRIKYEFFCEENIAFEFVHMLVSGPQPA